jgi:hypothetical protein
MGAAVTKIADVKTDGLQKKPIVDDDEPDEWFVAFVPASRSESASLLTITAV